MQKGSKNTDFRQHSFENMAKKFNKNNWFNEITDNYIEKLLIKNKGYKKMVRTANRIKNLLDNAR